MQDRTLAAWMAGIGAFLSLVTVHVLPANGGGGGSPYILVLGIAQDGGIPHAGCMKPCCRDRWNSSEKKRHAAALAVVDPESNSWWLFEATPDLPEQLAMVQNETSGSLPVLPAGIFLTHAHIGHYPGLMYLGREAMGATGVPVFCLPRLKHFLEENGPWSQLISLHNIMLKPLQEDAAVELNRRVSVTPVLVPHRDEFSETAGFFIRGPKKTVVFIPDIDKWSRWSQDIREVVKKADLLFLDGTFYRNGEIAGRDMKEIPHPFIEESMDLFGNLSSQDKTKIHFIHLNHTNPAAREGSPAYRAIRTAGFQIAAEGWRAELGEAWGRIDKVLIHDIIPVCDSQD